MFRRSSYLFVLALTACSGSRAVPPVPEPQPTVATHYDVELVTLKARPTLVKAASGKPENAAELIAGALAEVNDYLKHKKIKSKGDPFVRTFLWTDAEWKFEAGLPVKKKLKIEGEELQASELPGGKFAKTVHVGPYDQISGAYKAIADWMVAQHLEKAGAPWESYVNDPGSTKAEKLKTEIYFPVR